MPHARHQPKGFTYGAHVVLRAVLGDRNQHQLPPTFHRGGSSERSRGLSKVTQPGSGEAGISRLIFGGHQPLLTPPPPTPSFVTFSLKISCPKSQS